MSKQDNQILQTLQVPILCNLLWFIFIQCLISPTPNKTSINSLCPIPLTMLLLTPYAFLTPLPTTLTKEYIFYLNQTSSLIVFPPNSSFILIITLLLAGWRNFELCGFLFIMCLISTPPNKTSINFLCLMPLATPLTLCVCVYVRACAYQGVRNVRFSENLACFVFLKHPFLDSSFCLITDDVQYTSMFFRHIKSSRKQNLIRPVYLTRKTSS